MNMLSERKVLVSELIAPDLALRSSAERLFDLVESSEFGEVVLDFKHVRSVTRSFAHEYLKRKKESAVKVVEANVSREVKAMLEFVQKSRPRTFNVINPHDIQLSAI